MQKNKILGWIAAAVLSIATPLAIGFEGTELIASPDPIGIPTACHGHTENVRIGQVYTKEQCKELLHGDLFHALSVLDASLKVPISDKTAAALSLFIMNVGEGNFRKSTLLKKLNRKDYKGACNELSRWVYAGGRKFRGLEIRRQKERELCLSGL